MGSEMCIRDSLLEFQGAVIRHATLVGISRIPGENPLKSTLNAPDCTDFSTILPRTYDKVLRFYRKRTFFKNLTNVKVHVNSDHPPGLRDGSLDRTF